MAEYNLVRIINNDSGSYTKTDLSPLYDAAPTSIQVAWDDVAEDFVVKIGAEELSDGPDITNYRIGLNTYFEFCEGTTLNKFQLNGTNLLRFPYVEKIQVANSAKCNAHVCDLRLTDVPLTTPDSGVGDGEIEVYATSTLSIQYKLEAFDYGDGQTSNTFTGLTAGNYTVYIVDEYNCKISVDVTVQEGDAYAVKYRAEFDGLNDGLNGKLEIFERGYSGSVEDIRLEGESGLFIDYHERSLDSFYESPIWSSSLTVNLYAPENDEDKYSDLYTQDDRKYLGVYTRDGDEVWRGYITPALYSKTYFNAASFTFVDGLESLSREPMLNNGEQLEGKIGLINLIAFILNKLGLDLNIKSGVNLYSQGMNTTNDPLQQAYLDASVFYESGEAWSCYDALLYILKPFGARIHQYGGQWVIQRLEELGTTYNYRIFNSNGLRQFMLDGTENQVVNYNIKSVNSRIANMADGNTEIMPAYGKVSVLNDMTLRNYLINNGDFEDGDNDDVYPFKNWNVLPNGNLIAVTGAQTTKGRSLTIVSPTVDNDEQDDQILDALVLSNLNTVRYGPGDTGRFTCSFGFDRIDKAFPWVTVRYKVLLKDSIIGGTTLYLQPDGTFGATDVTNRFYLSPQGTFQEQSIDFEYPDVDVETTGYFQVWIYNSTTYSTEYTDSTGSTIQAIPTEDLPDGFRIVNVNDPTTGGGTKQFWELTVGTAPGTNTITTDLTPNDYDAGTNRRYWSLVKQVTMIRAVNNKAFVIDDVNMEYFPSGLEPEKSETITYVNSGRIPEEYETDIRLGGLPVRETPNDRYLYLHHFTDTLGAPIDKWGRKDIEEADKIQQIFLDMISNQHRTPSKKLSGTFSAQEDGGWGDQISPSNVIYNQFDSKYYIQTGLTIDEGGWKASMIMVEVKVNSDGSVPSYRAFSNAFSNAFS